MISIYKIKPWFQQLLKPALERLHRAGISANQITIASIVLSAIIGVCFWFADSWPFLFLALPIGLLFRMALNALDGMMARIYNQQSRKGELLNEIGDVISDIFIFFPLLKFEKGILYLIILFIVLAIVNEFAGVLGKVIGSQRRYDGPMGKSDRAFVMGIYGIVSFLQVPFQSYSDWIFTILIILICISTAIRIKKSWS